VVSRSSFGTFTIAAARRISGTVYALDIDPLLVRATINRAAREGVRNVVVETRDFVSQGCGRTDGSVSFVMLFNILHIEHPMTLLREAHRVLRVGGTAGVIHWRRDIETPRGRPRNSPRPGRRAWAEDAGLRCSVRPIYPIVPGIGMSPETPGWLMPGC
jgi:SAM-dependent methyltransferase